MLITTACAVISAAGLGIAFLVARRRRYAAALRVAAVALLPVGLALTGVVRFVVHMTLNPLAWAGFAVLGLAVLMFLGARFADGRGTGGRAAEAADPPVTGAASGAAQSALPATRDVRAAPGPAKSGGAEDFSDIEEILKKHGI
jgi:O-antigen/teichoic acid export membrane protein